MKKIILLMVLVQMMIASVCYAFREPDSNRWLWVGSTNKTGCWVDAETVSYKKEDRFDYSHKGHNMVDIWVLIYDVEKDISTKQRTTYDIDCRVYKINNYIEYDKNENIINTGDTSYMSFVNVIPETWTESLCIICELFWENDPKNKLR